MFEVCILFFKIFGILFELINMYMNLRKEECMCFRFFIYVKVVDFFWMNFEIVLFCL